MQLGSLVLVRSKHRGVIKGMVLRPAEGGDWIVKPIGGQMWSGMNILAAEKDMKVINGSR